MAVDEFSHSRAAMTNEPGEIPSVTIASPERHPAVCRRRRPGRRRHVLVRGPRREGGTAQRDQQPGLLQTPTPRLGRRILLQRTTETKTHKERVHLDLETDDVQAEVRRLEALGATRYDHQQERGYDFWVLHDP
jgi:hypothetical protein